MMEGELLTPSFFAEKRKQDVANHRPNKSRNLQTFLLKGDASPQPDRIKGERHPQRKHHGTPVRGGDTKKKGRGGKGTWEGNGTAEPMKNGALDRHDPNYLSSSSEESSPQSSSPPAGGEPAGFKRIALDQLFGGNAVVAESPPQEEARHAGGAHHTQMPEAAALPLPSSLTSTPQKRRTAPPSPMPAAAPPTTTSTDAVRLEQSLKALLKIGS